MRVIYCFASSTISQSIQCSLRQTLKEESKTHKNIDFSPGFLIHGNFIPPFMQTPFGIPDMLEPILFGPKRRFVKEYGPRIIQLMR